MTRKVTSKQSYVQDKPTLRNSELTFNIIINT